MEQRFFSKNIYPGLERALEDAKKQNLISCNRQAIHTTKIKVEQIIRKLITAIRKQSSTFDKLYDRVFNGGSVYEQTKIGKADEFDFDILLKIPDEMQPVLIDGDVAGFAQLQLGNFPETKQVFQNFVDHDNFILSHEMATSFIQNIFEKTLLNFFPNLTIEIEGDIYTILKIAYVEPAITLTIEGPKVFVDVDLVTSFVLSGDFWPGGDCRRNSYTSPSEFLLTPARPKDDHTHRNRFWRLSFHLQERQIVFNRCGLKPALRVLKCVRDHFKHTVRSYAIKTIFLWELCLDNPRLDRRTPDLWKTPLGCIVVHMLEKYLECLDQGNVPDFWNRNLNLLCYLTDDELEKYKKDVARVIDDVKNNPETKIFLEYLK